MKRYGYTDEERMEDILRIITKMPPECIICGKPVPDYEPRMCCDGMHCGCRGLPIEPCVCSQECDRAVYDYIGKPFEERRKLAGIKKWRRRLKEEYTHQ